MANKNRCRQMNLVNFINNFYYSHIQNSYHSPSIQLIINSSQLMELNYEMTIQELIISISRNMIKPRKHDNNMEMIQILKAEYYNALNNMTDYTTMKLHRKKMNKNIRFKNKKIQINLQLSLFIFLTPFSLQKINKQPKYQQYQDTTMDAEKQRRQRQLFQTNIYGSAYLHRELTKKTMRQEVKIKDLKFSWVLKSFGQRTINLLHHQKDCWVILPTYENKRNQDPESQEQDKLQNQTLISQVSDVQLAVTGRIKIGESPEQATIREIKQQIGLDIRKEDITWLQGQKKHVRDTRGIPGGKVYPSVVKLQQIQEPRQLDIVQKLPDDKRKESIQTWLLVKDFKDINFLRRKRCSKDSAGKIVVIMKASKLIKILQQFKQNYWDENWSPDSLSTNNKQQDVGRIVNLDELRGYLPCETSQQSTKVQESISKMNRTQIWQFIEKYSTYFGKIMCHKQANYIISKLLQCSEEEQRIQIFDAISPELLQILFFNKFGGICLTSIANSKKIDIQDLYYLFDLTFEQIKDDFITVSKHPFANHYIKAIISRCPLDLVYSIADLCIKDEQTFSQMISDQCATTVMQKLIAVIAQLAKDDENAQKIKTVVLALLEKNLDKAVSSHGTYFIQAAYEIFTIKQMNKVTQQLFNNFRKFSIQQKSVIFMADCVKKHWKEPFYKKFYDQLVQTLSEEDIKQMYETGTSQKLLRYVLMIKKDLKIKDKIAKVIFDMPIIHFQSAWKIIKKELQQTYEKVNGVLVRKVQA